VKSATTGAARKRAGTPAPRPTRNVATGFPLPLDTAPMEARSAEVLPSGHDWQYEPKWDGFRCLAFRAGDAVNLRAKSGKPLGRYFPEIVALLRGVAAAQFVVDGEIVIALDGRLSFDALQMRLHPAASRIRELSNETPARLILFDMLAAPSGVVLTREPLRRRRKALEAFMKTAAVPEKLVLSPFTSCDVAVGSRRCNALMMISMARYAQSLPAQRWQPPSPRSDICRRMHSGACWPSASSTPRCWHPLRRLRTHSHLPQQYLSEKRSASLNMDGCAAPARRLLFLARCWLVRRSSQST
jgi:ATP dependent DNA ligase domain